MNNPHQNACLTVLSREQIVARVAGRLGDATIALIVHLRRSLRMTGAAIAAKLGLARSTVARWLRREGLGRLARIDPPEPVRRYQRERPGEMIHPDIKKLGRFEQPGHRVTGTRVACRNWGAGWDFVHVAGVQFGRFMAQQPPCLVAMEACASARHRAREMACHLYN